MYRVIKCYFHTQSIKNYIIQNLYNSKLYNFVETLQDFLFYFSYKVVAPGKFACLRAGSDNVKGGAIFST